MNVRGAKRYPIRGLLAGLFAGIAIALFLVMAGVLALGDAEPIIVVAVGIVAGVAWALVGPTRTRGGKTASSPEPAAEPAASS